MSDKKGRPLTGYEAKDRRITIRLEPFEYSELRQILLLTGHTQTQALREGLRMYMDTMKRQLAGGTQNEIL